MMTSKFWFIVSVTIWVLCFMAPATSSAPAHLPKDLEPCLAYVEWNSTFIGPSNNCCAGVKNIKCLKCMCGVAKNAAKYEPRINVKRFLGLPDVCCVTDDPIRCEEETPKPKPKPVPKAPPPAVPVPPPAEAPPQIIPTPPAEAPPQIIPTPPRASGATELFAGSFTAVAGSLVAAVFFQAFMS